MHDMEKGAHAFKALRLDCYNSFLGECTAILINKLLPFKASMFCGCVVEVKDHINRDFWVR